MSYDPSEDDSLNHLLTVKYHTKSYLQMIGRIPIPQAEIVKRERAVSPDFVVVDGTRYYKKVKTEGVEVLALKEVDGVILID
jgi:hypothetical protein